MDAETVNYRIETYPYSDNPKLFKFRIFIIEDNGEEVVKEWVNINGSRRISSIMEYKTRRKAIRSAKKLLKGLNKPPPPPPKSVRYSVKKKVA